MNKNITFMTYPNERVDEEEPKEEKKESFLKEIWRENLIGLMFLAVVFFMLFGIPWLIWLCW